MLHEALTHETPSLALPPQHQASLAEGAPLLPGPLATVQLLHLTWTKVWLSPPALPILTAPPPRILHPKAGAMSLPRAEGFSSPKREKPGPQLPGPLQILPAPPNTGTATHEHPVRVPPFVTKSS